jgi:hypothetical protein
MDNFQGDPQSPLTLHKYLYTGDDPVNEIDPSGNDSLAEVLTSLAIQSVLGSIVSITLASPLGTGPLAYIVSKFLPPNFVNDVLAASPDAGILGTNVSASLSRYGVGLSGGGGFELVTGLKGKGQSVLFGYIGDSFFAGNTPAALGVTGYAGILYAAEHADDYAGISYTIGIPLSLLPASLGTKIKTNLAGFLLLGQLSSLGGGLSDQAFQTFEKVFQKASAAGTSLLNRGSVNLGFGADPPNATSITFGIGLTTASSAQQTTVSVGIAEYFRLTPDVPFR